MSITSRALLIGVLLAASTLARSDGIMNSGGLDAGFPGGVGYGGTIAVIPSCPSPTAPDGNVDLSQCSNAYYAALIF